MGITFPKTSLEYIHMPDIIIRVLEIHSQKMSKYDENYRYLIYLKEISFKRPTDREGLLNQF